jgi:hypothetical protein
MEGRLMVRRMESAILLPRASLSSLLASGEIDAWALMGLFREAHGATPGKLFAASPAAMERDRCIGRWDRHRYRNAIRKLCDLGELEQVCSGGKGPHDPAMYRLRPLAKGGKSPPILIRHPPPSPPVLEAQTKSGIFANGLPILVGHLGACREPETAARDSHLPGEPEYRPTLAQGRTCTAWPRAKFGGPAAEGTKK